MTTKRRNANNRNRGKIYERRIALALGGVRNLDKSRPHTDVETEDAVYEVKSTQASVPRWIAKAMEQCRLASEESNKAMGGVVKVFTRGTAKAYLIQELPLHNEETDNGR
tara:strand:- start:126 stop:455 length:330 start_codon:yes stop_codon:yes gene_type:complete